MFWAQSLPAGNGAGVTCLRESRAPITTLNVATYVKPFMVRNFWRIFLCQIATVDGVWVNLTNTHDAFEKKLDTEFKQLNNSVQSMHNRLQESLTAVNATMNEKVN